MSRVPISIGDVDLNTGTPDSNGILWTCGWPDGWDGAEQRTQVGEPTARHGGFATENLFGARDVTIKGVCRFSTAEAAEIAYATVTGSMPGLNGTADLVVGDTGDEVWLSVAQGGHPFAERPDAEKGYLLWQLFLRADYPLKRGLTAVTVELAAGATVSVAHAGTFPAEFTATTTSTGTVSLSAGGLTLSSASVASGTVFDSLEHTITSSGGADLYGSIGVGAEWPAVEVGSRDWVNAGTADVELSFYPTFS